MNTKVTIVESETEEIEIIPMCDMKPGQIAREIYSGNIVMRTLSVDNFEVMDMCNFIEKESWENEKVSIKVQILHKAEIKIILNKEK
jgi:hypothetical protein